MFLEFLIFFLFFRRTGTPLVCSVSDFPAKTDTISDSTDTNDTGVLLRTASSQQRLRFRLSGGTPCGRVLPAQPGEGHGVGRCWPLSRTPSSGGGAMAWPVRYRIIGLLFCSSVVNYVDRVNISVAAPVIMRETGWDKGSFGLVFSAFLIGYALLQIPGGVIADRWSARKILALSFCGFSLFTALTPLGQHAFFLLLALRFLVGAFESVTFPSLTSL